MLDEALFLWRRHGWSWRDLQEAPAELVDLLRLIDSEASQHG